MRVLVTGGAGFIGSALVRRLLRSGRHERTRVTTFDALTYAGRRENLDEVAGDSRHELVVGDVADDAAVEALFTGAEPPDTVLHLAAESHVDRALEKAAVFVRTNVQGTRALLDAARRHGVERFVYVSTDEVYGPVEPPARATEDSPLRPSNPYSVSKAAGDMMALAYHRSHGVPVTVLRLSNCYGPRQFPEKLIPLACSRALAGETIPVYGDGLQVREWLYVDDAAEAIVRAMVAGRAGRAYNAPAGADGAHTNLELLGMLLDRLGKPRTLLRHVPDRPGHDRRYAMDGGRAAVELEWKATTPLARGLDETVRWYRSHPDWLASAQKQEEVKRFMMAQYGDAS